MWNFEEQVNHRKTHVHRDDLHALLWTNTTTSASAQTLSAGNDVYQRFITGSKDNQVRLWDISPSGSIELQGEVRTRGDSNSWITALTRAYTRDHFIYGTRDGVVGFIHSELGQIKQFPLPQRFNPKCKTKNQNRITTVYSMHEYDRDLHEYVLIGKPKSLLCARIQYNAQAQPKEEDKSNDDDNEKKQDAVGDKTMNLVIEYEEELHSNDWVYCLYPINTSPHGYIFTCVVTGSSLDIYSLPSQIDGKKSARPKSGGKKGSHVQHVVKVWSEDRHTVKEGRNRAHLAHLEGLKKTNPVWISAACFDASVRVFDLEQQRTVTTLRRGDNIRYWQTQEYAEHLILSGADDGYLRLWDLRMPSHKANVAKSRRHNGRVSAFIINPLTQTIMTASCHSNPNHPSSTGANLRLFDLRSMSKDVSSTNMDELSAKLDNVKI